MSWNILKKQKKKSYISSSNIKIQIMHQKLIYLNNLCKLSNPCLNNNGRFIMYIMKITSAYNYLKKNNMIFQKLGNYN